MKKTIIRSALFGILLIASLQLSAQKSRFQAIQGLGYLHTQVSLILDNWEMHPLNAYDLDEFQEEYKQHFIEVIEHDEEWVEFIMVEDNLLFQIDEQVSTEVETALEENLEFYRKVIDLLQNPDEMDSQLEALRNEMQGADARLYEQIYPAICK